VRVRDSRTDKPIVQASRTPLEIVPVSLTVRRIVRVNQMVPTIAVQHLVRASPTLQRIVPGNRIMVQKIAAPHLVLGSPIITVPTIVPVSRTLRTIVVPRLVRASRTMPRTIAPGSQTTTGTSLVQALLITAVPATMLLAVAPTIMLLGPALRITVRLLQKPAMLLGTTVVRGRCRVRRLVIVLTRCLSSNRGNTRAPVPRTIVHKNNHRHGLKTIDHNRARKIIVRLKLRRQGPSSQPVRRILGPRRDRTIDLKLRRLKIGSSATIRLRKRALHSRLRNARAGLCHRHSGKHVRRLRRPSERVAQLLRSGTTIRQKTRSLLRTKISSRQTGAEQHFPNYRPAFNGWLFSFSGKLRMSCSMNFAVK
jgi:hypothetical protein